MSRDCRDFSQESWKLSVVFDELFGKNLGLVRETRKIGMVFGFLLTLLVLFDCENTEQTVNSRLTGEIE
jgi:hypothetical protein